MGDSPLARGVKPFKGCRRLKPMSVYVFEVAESEYAIRFALAVGRKLLLTIFCQQFVDKKIKSNTQVFLLYFFPPNPNSKTVFELDASLKSY